MAYSAPHGRLRHDVRLHAPLPVATAWSNSSTIGAGTSRLIFFDRESEQSRIPTAEAEEARRLLDIWLTPDILESAVNLRVPARRWCFVRAQPTLHVTILGASVSAGCGAEMPSIRCRQRWSWARHFRDRLSAMLANAGHSTDIKVRVWAKNAIDATYFAQCTESRFKLSAATGIVLIELEGAYQALGANGLRAVRALLSRIQRGAPHAVLGFVAWPSTASDPRSLETALRNATGTRGETFDTVFATPLLHAANAHASHPTRYYPTASYYADHIHPNLAGHALLGNAAAYMVGRGILEAAAGCARQSLAGRRRSPSWIAAHRLVESQALAAPPRAAAQVVELCINSADELPVVPPLEGWALRDEGGAKGVRKLGYASGRVGASLRIGPLLPSIQCGLFDVSLSYLQSWRQESGAFRITCEGCTCNRIPGGWSDAFHTYPFPLVQTWSYGIASGRSNRNAYEREFASIANASLTVSTRFALHKDAPDCYLNVTHVRRAGASVSAPSRVRIDALGIELASCQMACHLSRYPNLKAFARKARLTCAKGVDRGLPGHVSPACFANGTQSCRQALKKADD